MSSPIIAAPASMMPHINKVLNGEYDIPELKFDHPPIILDLGANVGSFTLWASNRWPNAVIHAYEPHPGNYALLQQNVRKSAAVLYNTAVSDYIGHSTLFDGRNNCGEASLYKSGEQSDNSQDVDVCPASTLPPADILKIDTEGSEWPILLSYRHLDTVSAVVLEWHSKIDRERIAKLLKDKGFSCYQDQAWASDRGIMKWTRGIEKVTPPGVSPASVNLLIACPCYGGQTYATHNTSLMNLILELWRAGVRHEQRYLPNESLIPRARNRFGTMMVQGDYTHLLFLDVDIGFEARDIISLIALDKDIVALPYSGKDFDWKKIVQAVKKGVTDGEVLRRCAGRPIINATEKTTFEITEAVQFPQLGTGILLIKRCVFEKMAGDPRRRYKLMHNERADLKDDYAYDFFRIGVNPETNYYDSEDYRFCIDAQKLGFETWLWPNAVTSHTGPYQFLMDIPTQASLGINLNDPEVKAQEPPVCTTK